MVTKQAELDLRVVRSAPEHPVVQVKFVEAGDFLMTWRWEHAPDQPRVVGIPRTEVQPALDALAAAVPSPQPGESVSDAVTRALRGPFGDRDREVELGNTLARALLPWAFAAELNDLILRGIRTHVRIQPSPSLGRVPWEALRVDEGERFVHNAEVSVLPPASVRNAAGRTVEPRDPSGPVVAVLDPPVPGGGTSLGRILDPNDATIEHHLARLAPRLVLGDGSPASSDGPLSGLPVTRDDLQRTLAEAARLLYVGHVTSADHALDVRLHLSCGPSTTGRAAVVHGHRPLTAADLAHGHNGHGPWRLPHRVALLACDSGGEGRFAEPSGLVAVAVRGGAELVTAARWTLPTDAGLEQLTGRPSQAFAEAVVAVDAAHEADDPVVAMAAWQRVLADRWEQAGDLAASPLVWGAFMTAYAPAKL